MRSFVVAALAVLLCFQGVAAQTAQERVDAALDARGIALAGEPESAGMGPDTGTVYARNDYVTAIYAACERYGCDPNQLIRVVDCETGGTWNHGVVGPNGERGIFQFHPNGEWPYAAWYGPYEQIELAAQLFADGRADAWVCK